MNNLNVKYVDLGSFSQFSYFFLLVLILPSCRLPILICLLDELVDWYVEGIRPDSKQVKSRRFKFDVFPRCFKVLESRVWSNSSNGEVPLLCAYIFSRIKLKKMLISIKLQ